jgi:hypothetical protein
MKSKFGHNIDKLLNNNYYQTLNEQLDELSSKGIKISFITIHKLLNYENNYDVSGERVFIKTKKSNINLYDMIIIDECSMLSVQVINHIFEDVNQQVLKKSFRLPKILFVGDPAQLPPVNEKMSLIFSNGKIQHDLKYLKQNLQDDEDDYYDNEGGDTCDKKINTLIKDIIKQESFTLKKVMRTNNDNIIGLCQNIRKLIDNNTKPTIKKFCDNKLFVYKKSTKSEKWLKRCIKYFKNDATSANSNIVLTWTNRQSDIYNNNIRKALHSKKKLDKYEIGDILVLSDFYNFDENPGDKYKQKDDVKDNRFYTSEQIKVKNIQVINKTCNLLKNTFSKEAKKIKNSRILEEKFRKTIDAINKKAYKYKVYKLFVQKLFETTENNIPETYIIYVIHDSDMQQWKNENENIMNKITELRKFYKISFKENLRSIDTHIIKPAIKEFNTHHINPFAKVNYGVSMTVHKSQSSSYYNVFVDVDDILLNKNHDECKRCVYTALTRTVNELHLLI